MICHLFFLAKNNNLWTQLLFEKSFYFFVGTFFNSQSYFKSLVKNEQLSLSFSKHLIFSKISNSLPPVNLNICLSCLRIHLILSFISQICVFKVKKCKIRISCKFYLILLFLKIVILFELIIVIIIIFLLRWEISLRMKTLDFIWLLIKYQICNTRRDSKIWLTFNRLHFFYNYMRFDCIISKLSRYFLSHHYLQ